MMAHIKIITASLSAMVLLLLLLLAGGCDGDKIWENTNNTQAPALLLLLEVLSHKNYAIIVTVTGLPGGTTLVLTDGIDNLSITGNGKYPFATRFANGVLYNVTVTTQPSPQSCDIVSGSGTGTINKSNVLITFNCH
jgi:hypothetical protein